MTMHLVKSSVYVSLLGLVLWFGYIFTAYGFFAPGDLPVVLAIAFGSGAVLVCIFCHPVMSLFKRRLGIVGFTLLGLFLGFVFTVLFVLTVSHRSANFQLLIIDSWIWHILFGSMGAAYGSIYSIKQQNKALQSGKMSAARRFGR